MPAEIIIPPLIARVSERWGWLVNLLLRVALVGVTCEYKAACLSSPMRMWDLLPAVGWRAFTPCLAASSPTAKVLTARSRLGLANASQWAKVASR